jgi:hypothetical protein
VWRRAGNKLASSKTPIDLSVPEVGCDRTWVFYPNISSIAIRAKSSITGKSSLTIVS